MKAVVYDKGEAPSAFVFRDVERPTPNDNEVLVRIHAASLNAGDIRSMKLGMIPKRRIFGSDIAGRVEATGKAATRFSIGDEVFGDLSACGCGGFAEYVTVPERALALKPTAVSFETAAAVPLAAVTALQALRDKGHIQAGQRVLICGAGGGVGTYAIQLAKYFGAEVTAVCGEKNVQVAQSLGADYVIDYAKEDFAKSSKRYDLVIAVNGNRSSAAYMRALAPKGISVMVGGALSQVFKFLLFGGLMSLGSKKARSLTARPDTRDLDFIIKLVEEGKLKPIIDRSYPLHETAQAMRYLGDGHVQGKVIIAVAPAAV